MVEYDFYTKGTPIKDMNIFFQHQHIGIPKYFMNIHTGKSLLMREFRSVSFEGECPTLEKWKIRGRKIFYSLEYLHYYFRLIQEYFLCPFYVVSQHNVKWIEHVNLTCGTVDSYEVISAQTKEHCKHACAKDNKCLIVMYDPQKKNCWKSSSDMQHSRKCSSKYNFYQKGKSSVMET
jgi:hypothetical protein